MVNQKRLLKIFFKLVRIDSPTGEEAEVIREVLDYLRKLNLEPTKDRAGNVFVKIAGKGKPLLLEAHFDTVEPGQGIEPYQKGEFIYSKGDNILGADDKASIAIILELLNIIRENNLVCRPLEILFSTGEEAGLLGISHFDFRKVKAKEAIGMDRAKRVGVITLVSPHIKTFALTILGKAAHAGACPEKGINVIMVASRIISQLPYGRIDRETTFNIGLISGGRGTNIVPDKVVLEGEARSFNQRKLEGLIKNLEKAAREESEREGARYKLKILRVVKGYRHRASDPLIQKICRAMQVCKVQPELLPSGGASDLNILWEHNIKAVEIANGVQYSHTKKERVRVQDLVKMTEILLKLVQK